MGIGCDGFKASHLDHDDHPLPPSLRRRTLDGVLCGRWVSSR